MDRAWAGGRAVATRGLHRQLHRVLRAWIRVATELLHALPPVLLRGEATQLRPNSISQAAVFAVVCEGYLGIEAHWELWLHLFWAELFTKADKGTAGRRVVRAGGCTLQLRQDRAALYIPAQHTSSNHGWQGGWFYLCNDDGGLPPYMGWILYTKVDN